MAALPTGTVTFLFTDIEGSTRLLQQLRDVYADVLVECRLLIATAVREGGGQEVDTEGDAVFAAFPSASQALLAAVTAQQRILRHPWPDGAAVRVRIGLHTGEARIADAGYVGMDVHRAARICGAAHGGQILLSDTTSALVTKDLPDGVGLRDLGEHHLKDLIHAHHLFQAVAAGLPTDFPPIRSLNVLPNNLPRQLTSFIGREKEMAEVKRLLSTAYLVTLTGSGGAGKTRLALQVAADVVNDYPDGVWLAEFAPLADPALIPKAVATVLNVPEQPGRDMTETLVDALRPKALLLLFDNCEHLLAACRDLAGTLLRKCPHLRILATSREGLGVPGETLWRVPSLSVPEDVRHLPPPGELVLFDAVRLFVDRAVATAPGFAVTGQNAPAVAQVCQRLDGIPLAIELAAARVSVLAVKQIAARLDDRFKLLTGGSPTLLPRHQTLHAAIDWSYQLLSETERVLLRRLSVFAGGWSLEAAESVCAGGSVGVAAVLDLLTSLVAKSLVLAETQRGEARYRLLETVRQYSMSRLLDSGEADAVRRRHRDWYVSLAEQAFPEYFGPRATLWVQQLETEHDNLRTAVEWSRAEKDGAEAGLRLTGNLWWFLVKQGHLSEAREWLEGALARRTEAPTVVLPRALRGASQLAWRRGDYELATTLATDGLAICRELGDRNESALLFLNLGIAALRRGDFEQAAAMCTECLNISREMGNRWVSGEALWGLGSVEQLRRNPERAIALYTESLADHMEAGDRWAIGKNLCEMGTAAHDLHDYARALACYKDSLTIVTEIGDRSLIAACLEGLAKVALSAGHHDKTARLFGAVESLRQSLEWRRSPAFQLSHDHAVASMRAALGDVAFAAMWATGRAMTPEQAIEYALEDAT